MKNNDNILLNWVMNDRSCSQDEALDAIENWEYILMTEQELHENIAENLDMDSWSKVQERYFDWKGYIRDLEIDRVLVNLKTWPENLFIWIYR